MKEQDERVAFWLTPAAREQKFFAQLIEELAREFNAPVFEPHLTLHGGNVDSETALDAISKLSAQPICSLEVKELDVSEKFAKTLFLRFQPSRQLTKLRNVVGDAFRLETPDDFDPHLSLLYKEMPLAEKAQFARTIKIPFDRVNFDNLVAIAHPPEIRSPEDVKVWRVLGRRSLVATTR